MRVVDHELSSSITESVQCLLYLGPLHHESWTRAHHLPLEQRHLADVGLVDTTAGRNGGSIGRMLEWAVLASAGAGGTASAFLARIRNRPACEVGASGILRVEFPAWFTPGRSRDFNGAWIESNSVPRQDTIARHPRRPLFDPTRLHDIVEVEAVLEGDKVVFVGTTELVVIDGVVFPRTRLLISQLRHSYDLGSKSFLAVFLVSLIDAFQRFGIVRNGLCVGVARLSALTSCSLLHFSFSGVVVILLIDRADDEVLTVLL